MRISFAGLLLLLAASCDAADFSVTSVTVGPNVTTQGVIVVEVAGDLPPNLTDASAWVVTAVDRDAKKTYRPKIFSVKASASGFLTLTFNPSDLNGTTAGSLDWQASLNSTSSPQPTPPSTGISLFGRQFGSANTKDDADIYLFGSFLAGGSTKPIYTIDAKINWQLLEIGYSGWKVGLAGTFSSNTDAMPPNDRSRIDPDSITGALSVHKVIPAKSLVLDFNPVQGEFSRKTVTSDIVTSGMAKYIGGAGYDHGVGYAFYPSLGYELGHNLNKPTELYSQPIDLRGYNAIVRGVATAHTALLFFKSQVTTTDTYLLTLQADYTVRSLLEPEPFVTSGFSGSMHTTPVSLRTNARHYLEIGLSYNPNPYLGITAKYKWGSLPPLFQFVDHQVVIGVTFSAKQ